jgi:hypothetical protein
LLDGSRKRRRRERSHLSINGQSTVDQQPSRLADRQPRRASGHHRRHLSQRARPGSGTGSPPTTGGGITYNAGPSGALTVDNVAHTVDFSAAGAICLASLACAPTSVFDLSGATVTKPARNATRRSGHLRYQREVLQYHDGYVSQLPDGEYLDQREWFRRRRNYANNLPAGFGPHTWHYQRIGWSGGDGCRHSGYQQRHGWRISPGTDCQPIASSYYVDRQPFSLLGSRAGANTGAGPTLQINSTPPYPIVKNGNTALAAADINPPAKACVLFDLANSRFSTTESANCSERRYGRRFVCKRWRQPVQCVRNFQLGSVRPDHSMGP